MFRSVAGVAALLAACGVPNASHLEGGTTEIAPAPQLEQRGLLSVPPLTGGTLLVTKGKLAIASDPERDVVWVVDLDSGRVRGWLTLEIGDEPGRAVEDGNGNVHVALRRGGDLVTFDPRADTFTVMHRRPVCGEPRGVALDGNHVVVACSTGELVWLPIDGGPATSTLTLERDLRDVLVRGDKLTVTTFRSAQVLELDRYGAVTTRSTLPNGHNSRSSLAPSVAWKTVELPGGKLATVHHRSKIEAVALSTSGTGGGPEQPPFPGDDPESPYGSINNGFTCPESIVDSAVTITGPTGEPRQAQLTSGSLPIDVAVDETGYQIAVVTASPGTVSIFYAANVIEQATLGQCNPVERTVMSGVQPIAVAWSGNTLVAQLRDPVGLQLSTGKQILFPTTTRIDRGFTMFHAQAGAPLACASCHAEGRDDGRVWEFIPDGTRRTQAINGGLLRTAPFHWDGTLSDIGVLMNEVFVKRMGGHDPTPEDVTSLATWLDKLPAARAHAATDTSAVERGQALFESPAVACASCHSGVRLTNNTTVDVGTGGKLQVPSLTGLSARGPWMHTGCAKTLRDRFGVACGGGDLHGTTSQLTPTEVDDLVAYLQTL